MNRLRRRVPARRKPRRRKIKVSRAPFRCGLLCWSAAHRFIRLSAPRALLRHFRLLRRGGLCHRRRGLFPLLARLGPDKCFQARASPCRRISRPVLLPRQLLHRVQPAPARLFLAQLPVRRVRPLHRRARVCRSVRRRVQPDPWEGHRRRPSARSPDSPPRVLLFLRAPISLRS
jgi:hypothetical protein